MSVIRVLQLGNYGDDGGGISSVLREYAAWDWPNAKMAFVDTYATAPRLWGIKRILIAVRTLIRNRHQVDVVHLHISQRGSFIREGMLVLLASFLRIRVIVTLHGSSFVDFARGYSWLVYAVLSKADEIAALTGQTAKALRELGLMRVTLIPNAVSMDGLAGDEIPFSERRTAVFAGEVSQRKGVDVLLDAWEEISSEFPDARLEIFGTPVDVTVPDCVSIVAHGRRPRGQVRSAVRRALLLVLPSRAEAFPMSILEAMVAGVPVVATDVGQIREMLGDDELVVPSANASRLATAMRILFANAARAEVAAKRNLERYRSHYSPSVVARKYEALYRGD